MKRLLFNKTYKARIPILVTAIAVYFLMVLSGPAGYATTGAYESGYNHGCDDAGIADPSDRYINQPQKGPDFHTNEFMAGYNEGLVECSGNGNLDGIHRNDTGDEGLVEEMCMQSVLLCQQLNMT
jgi:hypothetical protein